MKIEVLGTGCRRCDELERLTRDAVARLGLDATVEHVDDVGRIMAYGVMSTPALVVDGRVRVVGRVPKPDEIERIVSEASA